MDLYQQFIAKSRYARYLPDEKRRENWRETVVRYIDFMSNSLKENHKYNITEELQESMFNYIYNQKVMPSMRAIMTAGLAAERQNIACYNCAYLPIEDVKCFDELMYILLCGTGVGFSVESYYTEKLPEIPDKLYKSDTTIVVADSKEGWAKSLRQLISLLYAGEIPDIDTHKVRPAGARLKTFGGRACLTGDTILYKDRKKSRGYNEITIKDLYDMERSQGKWANKPNHFKDVKIRSLNEETGKFYRNNVITVIDNGIAPIYEIVTKNGYRIKTTNNHRFLNQTGDYSFVSNFEVGDLIGVNGSSEIKTGTCIDCITPISKRATRCKSCYDETQKKSDCSHTTSRARKEVRDYRYKYQHCELCNLHEDEKRLEVHHMDGNPWNNNEENLLVVCPSCHRQEDMKRTLIGDPYSCKYLMFDEIISIEYIGEEQVYDLQMEAPNHNFVANGFVSHNSGPEPLIELFNFVIHKFKGAIGRQLYAIECHDICCKIAEIVVVGGVRRSALISLSDLSDDRMAHAKAGAWWNDQGQRSLANNSAVYSVMPSMSEFMKEWYSLYESKSGERGIFNREATIRQASINGRRETAHIFGVNPCSEIILRPYQFCNLSEVVVREEDTLETLSDKVEMATILGTFQSTLTHFPYLRKIWKKNCEEERLLGVSLTGVYDNKLTNKNGKILEELLTALKKIAVTTNKTFAQDIGINQSVAITCSKPSGTVSQLCNSSSGLHARHSTYYIRTIRNDIKDPLTQHMIEAGVPHEPCVMRPDSTMIFSFPIKSPKSSVCRNDIGAIEHLELWLTYQRYWCEHKPSVTISVKEEEWMEVGAWVYKHFDEVTGVSFLPWSGGTYKQAPYTECTKKEYEEMLKKMPKDVDWDSLIEEEDNVEGTQELACSSGSCEVI